MANKITKREVINAMLEVEAIRDNQTFVDYLTNELYLLDKRKNNKSDKPTKKQVENAGYIELIRGALAAGDSMSIPELKEAIPEFEGFTSQKISSLLTIMDKAGEISKDYDKKVAVFALKQD